MDKFKAQKSNMCKKCFIFTLTSLSMTDLSGYEQRGIKQTDSKTLQKH